MRVEIDVYDIESGEKCESDTEYLASCSTNINTGTYNLTFVPYTIARGFLRFDTNAAASYHAFITDKVDPARGTVRFKCFYDREYAGEWTTECTFEQAGIRIELHFDGRE